MITVLQTTKEKYFSSCAAHLLTAFKLKGQEHITLYFVQFFCYYTGRSTNE